ncbi:Ykud domain protein [Latilactobacillus curvatus]|uniref:L,D-transpeptidase n=1 Tax=Latilactobacillus curvatus TaxID=28038 RepID=UPI000A1A5949|nr:L,D-transpeptidase [Latilactobacillus curvatus]SMH69231.1 Ykud domain protein [Latilactobacillus curvatus]
MPKLTNNIRLMLGSIIVAIALLIGGYWSTSARQQTHQSAVTSSTKSQSHARQQLIKSKKTAHPTPIDWRAPSENKPYPNLDEQPDLWVDVSIAQQRVYLENDNDLLYTMHASTGSPESPTPTGTFYIEAEHGDSFFNANSGEGAKYWRSFLDHGIYLFHSVPTDEAGNFIPEEAEQLGKKANSHGCIRLSVADAQWFYTAIPYNTKVVIH